MLSESTGTHGRYTGIPIEISQINAELKKITENYWADDNLVKEFGLNVEQALDFE